MKKTVKTQPSGHSFTRQVSKVTWMEQPLSRRERTARPQSRLPACVPILPTR